MVPSIVALLGEQSQVPHDIVDALLLIVAILPKLVELFDCFLALSDLFICCLAHVCLVELVRLAVFGWGGGGIFLGVWDGGSMCVLSGYFFFCCLWLGWLNLR